MEDEIRYLNLKTAAQTIGCSSSYLRMLCETEQVKASAIPSYRGRPGTTYMIPEDEVERLMVLKEGNQKLTQNAIKGSKQANTDVSRNSAPDYQGMYETASNDLKTALERISELENAMKAKDNKIAHIEEERKRLIDDIRDRDCYINGMKDALSLLNGKAINGESD